jgi:hypothetical protein
LKEAVEYSQNRVIKHSFLYLTNIGFNYIILTTGRVESVKNFRSNLDRRTTMFGIPVEMYGYVAMIAGLSLFLFGVPKQIYDNYKAGYCTGSKVMQVCLGLVYFFWMMYGFALANKVVIWSNLPGFVVSLVLWSQYFFLRKKPSSP